MPGHAWPPSHCSGSHRQDAATYAHDHLLLPGTDDDRSGEAPVALRLGGTSAEAERNVANQREIIAQKERDGHETSMSKELLGQFEEIYGRVATLCCLIGSAQRTIRRRQGGGL
jgi:hypothetical protein